LGPSASGLRGFVGWSSGSPAIYIGNVEVPADGAPDYEGGELRLVRMRHDYFVHWREA
jgi:hypothetical protein